MFGPYPIAPSVDAFGEPWAPAGKPTRCYHCGDECSRAACGAISLCPTCSERVALDKRQREARR